MIGGRAEDDPDVAEDREEAAPASEASLAVEARGDAGAVGGGVTGEGGGWGVMRVRLVRFDASESRRSTQPDTKPMARRTEEGEISYRAVVVI